MASPLAEIDWNNLEDGSQSLVTAMNLLELMFAERMNVPTLINCANTNTTAVEVDRFPFLGNSPDYGQPTWPVTWGPPIPTLGDATRILRCYLSETKIAALLGGTTYGRFAATFDDATMFSDLGITSYPTLEVINATDVKTWFDILSSLKWIYSDYDLGNGGGGFETTTNFDSSYMEGIVLNPDQDPIFYGDIVMDMPPVSQFATDEALLFTGPTSKAIATSLSGIDYYLDQANFSGLVDNPPTRVETTIAKGYNRFDITPLVNAGHTGQPQAYRAYGHMGINSIDYSGRTTFSDYAASYPFQNQVISSYPDPTRTLVSGNIYEYEIPFNVPPTKPSGVVGEFSARAVVSIFENWDLENGFTYYTP